MPTCKKCNQQFPNSMILEGKKRNLQRRNFCLDCSPFGDRNTKPLHLIEPSDGTRTCSVCKRKLREEDFYRKGKFGPHSYCKECQGNFMKERWIQRKIDAVKLMGWKCEGCGLEGAHPALYDFHHRDLGEKECDWNKLRMMSWPKVVAELEKCQILCSNCHRLRHITNESWDRLLSQLS